MKLNKLIMPLASVFLLASCNSTNIKVGHQITFSTQDPKLVKDYNSGENTFEKVLKRASNWVPQESIDKYPFFGHAKGATLSAESYVADEFTKSCFKSIKIVKLDDKGGMGIRFATDGDGVARGYVMSNGQMYSDSTCKRPYECLIEGGFTPQLFGGQNYATALCSFKTITFAKGDKATVNLVIILEAGEVSSGTASGEVFTNVTNSVTEFNINATYSIN